MIDIGGGSTELVVGARGEVDFHVSTQVGVVRHTERHLHSDPPHAPPSSRRWPPTRARRSRPPCRPTVRERAGAAVAVAGTATSCAAIDLALDPYDPARVEGHVLSRARLEELRDRLAAVPLAERRDVTGLHPGARADDRGRRGDPARGAVARSALDGVEVSERDILWGVALDSATRLKSTA